MGTNSSLSTYQTTISNQFLNPSNNYFPTKKLYPLQFLHLQTQFLVPNCFPLLKCCYGGDEIDLFVTKIMPSYRILKKRQKCRAVGVNVIASVRETPYQVLGVSSNATPDQIKRAYRKLALKYHPDVNKEPNAQEKFMRIKHAYNTLLNPDSQRRYGSGNNQSDYKYSTTGRSRSTQEEEDFYGLGDFVKDVQITLGDFFRDLQEEFQNWEANASSQGKPKSLWEELADIGEEFVEFLEKELNITDQDTNNEQPRADPFQSVGEQRRNNVDNQSGGGSSIKESIDEIEATLAQLKKELGL